MKTITLLLLLILVLVSFSVFAEDTNTSATNGTQIVETNLTSGIPVVVTTTIFQATTLEPHGMLITVTYEQNDRCDGLGLTTNGCIVAEVAGPQTTNTSPHWLGP